MPVVYNSIPLDAVQTLLIRRGYGFHTGAYALQLNVASRTQRRKFDGQPRREVLRGITKRHLDIILQRSESPQEAADAIEQYSKGEISSIDEDVRAKGENGEAPQLDLTQLGRLIDNKVTSRIAALAEELRGEFSQTLGRIETLISGIAPQPTKEPEGPVPLGQNPPAVLTKKRGRPKGSKNKTKTDPPKPVQQWKDEPPDDIDETPFVERTPEEVQAMLDKSGFSSVVDAPGAMDQ